MVKKGHETLQQNGKGWMDAQNSRYIHVVSVDVFFVYKLHSMQVYSLWSLTMCLLCSWWGHENQQETDFCKWKTRSKHCVAEEGAVWRNLQMFCTHKTGSRTNLWVGVLRFASILFYQELEQVNTKLIKTKMMSVTHDKFHHGQTGKEQHVEKLHQRLRMVRDDQWIYIYTVF